MSERQREVWAIVPVKGFERGKSRLGTVLNDASRSGFARKLFDHVTGVLRAVEGIHTVLVLTDDAAVEKAALAAGLRVRRDGAATTLSAIVDGGLGEAEAHGASAALVCMADLPTLDGRDVDRIIEALADSEMVVVPDLEAAGTNVLCLAPPTRLDSCFGHADSFQRHLHAAAAAGAGVSALRLTSICFDVDGPEDLELVL